MPILLQRIKPTGLAYFFWVIWMVMGGMFFWPFFFWYNGFKFLESRNINQTLFKTLKYTVLAVAFLYFGFYLDVLFNLNVIPVANANRELFKWLYIVSEVFHFSIFVTYFIAIYRTIRYSETTYSIRFAAIYTMVHTLYNGCPVTLTQNYLIARSQAFTTANNEFWYGVFGDYTSISRVVFVLICSLLFYSGYKNLRKFNVNIRYWNSFWLENNYLPKKLKSSKLKMEN